MDKSIVLFSNNLRLHDNRSLTNAIEENQELLFLYVLTPKLLELQTESGFNRVGPFRYKFLTESIFDLKTNLKAKGQDLVIRYGETDDVLCELCTKHQITKIYLEKPLGYWENQELDQLIRCVPNTVEIIAAYDSFCIHPEDYDDMFDDVPDIFTEFRKKIESNLSVKLPLTVPNFSSITSIQSKSDDIPEIPEIEIESRTAFPFKGGETAALDRLKDYIWDSQRILNYKNTRDLLTGVDYSTKLSAWLANGSISPRKIWDEIVAFERAKLKNKSTYWLKFELLWRDYFRYVSRKYTKHIFHFSGINKKQLDLSKDKEKFEKWRLGKTNDLFVNANMKELLLTGWMSNRGRQNVASYLVHELKVDWRWGAEWFEHQLIDYDVNSNWCNWMYIAGVGNDPRPNRIFNTQLQAEKYDPTHRHRNLWLNEQD